ncbi:hypothetical protein PR003_g12815 [Phytophthora rubi]|uniref:Uncharacterized protein n=2 Tax=Phytophthora TaxID=4783 RepID=A0A6A3N3I2_9STRA|nr:hypothetical protein PR002_g7910 [Phytophthora rubi]KAE9040037.1 hypothetical protein PR001_g7256 [Phytophthora rubi]KAE9267427.1 hypothetical protein PF008_g31368 [Phytophthora fragariae]KAE9335830.1 hypothetical protein PR003_g12815 [Phytophthora rubi]
MVLLSAPAALGSYCAARCRPCMGRDASSSRCTSAKSWVFLPGKGQCDQKPPQGARQGPVPHSGY